MHCVITLFVSTFLFFAIASTSPLFAQISESTPLCYSVADNTNSESAVGMLVAIDLTNGDVAEIGPTNGVGVEAIALSPDARTLYAASTDTLGKLDLQTGEFTTIGPFGDGQGRAGAEELSRVVGLTFDVATNTLFGVHRRSNGLTDLLFKIDPASGAVRPNGFGDKVDYVELSISSGGDVDAYAVGDIAADPITGVLYGVVDHHSTSGALVTIDKANGVIVELGSLNFPNINKHIDGLGFFSNGSAATLYGSTGRSRLASADQNQLYLIDKTNGNATLIKSFPATATARGQTSLDCLTMGSGIGDYVWEDFNHNGFQDDDELPISGVVVNLWVDDDGDDQPDKQIESTTTTEAGLYEFVGLDPTVRYFIQFEPPAGYRFATQTTGSEETVDRYLDSATGITKSIQPNSGEFDATIDAGLLPHLRSSQNDQGQEDYAWAIQPSSQGVGGQNTDEFLPVIGRRLRRDSAYIIENLLGKEMVSFICSKAAGYNFTPSFCIEE